MLGMHKKGFTLAEVLITLGIIGVVAAITIPHLVTQIQDREFKTAAKEAFSKSAQAVQQIKMDNGGNLVGYYGVFGSFKPAFMTYFKVVRDCSASSPCVPETTSSAIYKTLYGVPANTSYGGGGASGITDQFITTDGMFFDIQNSTSADSTIGIVVDVNGYGKGPNVFGRDVFVFELVNDVLSPMGGPNTHYPASTFCQKTLNFDQQGLGCMYNVMQGIDY